MAQGILGLGSGQAASLNQDLIDKLKAADKKATVDPVAKRLEAMTSEKETFKGVQTQVSELLKAVKPFDLFVSGGVNAFNNKSATTSGDSAIFNATDVGSLSKGTTTVDISQLAQRDVFQSDSVNSAAKDSPINQGNLELTIAGKTTTFDTTNKSYTELAKEINSTKGVNASLEQVGSDSFRLVIKSEDSGTENAISFAGAASTALGLDKEANHTLTAHDLKATVDGVDYSSSKNVLNVDGLNITAMKTGTSSINVVDDDTKIETQMNALISGYNTLVDTIDKATGVESKISDRAGLRDVLNQVKDKLFGQYGESGDKSVFNYGIELNKDGKLSLDTKVFNKAVKEDKEGLKDLFIGTAAKEGIGTQLKATIDELNFSGGALNSYEKSMGTRETALKAEKTKAEEALETKYKELANQFASYSSIITSFQNSFAGLKMYMDQSTAKQS